MCGSPSYICPEMLSRQPYDGMKADVWAAGVILFAMVCGYLPFQETNINSLKLAIARSNYKMPSRVSKDAQDLIKSILQPVAEWRATIEEI